jgi:hypothetical protein
MESNKDDITTFTVDTENVSGHFDIAVSERVGVGSKVIVISTEEVGDEIVTTHYEFTIIELIGDGTEVDSVKFAGDLSVGEFSLSDISNILSTGNTIKTNRVSISTPVPLASGDPYQGGTAIGPYDFADGQTGFLIVPPSSTWLTQTHYGYYNIDMTTLGLSSNLSPDWIDPNTGINNTQLLCTYNGSDEYTEPYNNPVHHCNNLVYDGCNDYFLPNKNELHFIYQNRAVLNEAWPSDFVWSSSQCDNIETTWDIQPTGEFVSYGTIGNRSHIHDTIPVRRILLNELYIGVYKSYSDKYATAYLPCTHTDVKDIISYTVNSNMPETTCYTIVTDNEYRIYKNNEWKSIVRTNDSMELEYNVNGVWTEAVSTNTYANISKALEYVDNRMTLIDLLKIPQYHSGSISGITVSLMKPSDSDIVPEFSNGSYVGLIATKDVTIEQELDLTNTQFQDIKGNITRFIVDIANSSGHFNAPINDNIQIGSRVYVNDQVIEIIGIVDDGTSANSIEFYAPMEVREYTIDRITNMYIELNTITTLNDLHNTNTATISTENIDIHTIDELIPSEVPNGGSIWYTFRYGDEFKTYYNTELITIAKLENGQWYHLDGIQNWIEDIQNTPQTAITNSLLNNTIYRLTSYEFYNIPMFVFLTLFSEIGITMYTDEVAPIVDRFAIHGLHDDAYLIADTYEQAWSSGEKEDLKDIITHFVVDTPNQSGHFNAPINIKIKSGCQIYMAGKYFTIQSVEGSGIDTDSVTLAENTILSKSTYPVDGVYGIDNTSTVVADDIYSVMLDMSEHGLESLEQIVSIGDDNVYYFVGDGNTFKVYLNNVWYSVVTYTEGHWKYTDGVQWINSPLNTAQSAISVAASNVLNRMTKSQLETLPVDDLVNITHICAAMEYSAITNKTLSKVIFKGKDKNTEVTETDIKWRITSTYTLHNVNEIHGIRIQWKYK